MRDGRSLWLNALDYSFSEGQLWEIALRLLLSCTADPGETAIGFVNERSRRQGAPDSGSATIEECEHVVDLVSERLDEPHHDHAEDKVKRFLEVTLG